jgi:hypothetical protein
MVIAPTTSRPIVVWGWLLVYMVLLASTQVALRGLVMYGIGPVSNFTSYEELPEFNRVEICTDPSKHNHTDHNHSSPRSEHTSHPHCLLCFVHWLPTSNPAPHEAAYANVQHLKLQWVSARQARAEFLKTIAARAPPYIL